MRFRFAKNLGGCVIPLPTYSHTGVGVGIGLNGYSSIFVHYVLEAVFIVNYSREAQNSIISPVLPLIYLLSQIQFYLNKASAMVLRQSSPEIFQD